MKAAINLVLALAFLVPAAAVADAQTPGPGDETIRMKAQVIDLSCLTVHNLKGEDHRMCAQVCADQGVPLALLGEDGNIYHPVSMEMPSSGTELNAKLRPHAERTVTVAGKLVERAGSKGIIIESIEAQ